MGKIAISFIFLAISLLILSATESVGSIHDELNKIAQNQTLKGARPYKLTRSLCAGESNKFIGHEFRTSSLSIFVPFAPSRGAYSLVFTVSITMKFPGPQGARYLGKVNCPRDENISNHLFGVEFDTFDGVWDDPESNAGIYINITASISPELVDYCAADMDVDDYQEKVRETGNSIVVWIAYDPATNLSNLTIYSAKKLRPKEAPVLEPGDFPFIINDTIYVGFPHSAGIISRSQYISGFCFLINRDMTCAREHKRLLAPSIKGKSFFFNPVYVLSFAFVLGMLCILSVYRRMMQFRNLDDWEFDLSHTLRFKDLDVATKGFKGSEVIGVGGFGPVYKGVFRTSGVAVAVKRVPTNSVKVMKEFKNEIESFGRLRHKNLVHLQGWCKQKNDIFLVYDYIPNGCLHSLLFGQRRNTMLNWEQRFSILKDTATGLLYLHEKCEKVVIHGSIKSTNILIDADMNARLGDVGVARLYDQYKTSTSDMFDFGVLLLEVACGRTPFSRNMQTGKFILIEWVTQCHRNGRLLDAADPELGSFYVVEEMKLVLQLGLLCSQQNPEARPSINQALQYINGVESLPAIGEQSSF